MSKLGKEKRENVNELVQEVLKESIYLENLNQYMTSYFWLKNKKFLPIFADDFNEFVKKVSETSSKYLTNLWNSKVYNLLKGVK
jgi:hypothetical protein